MKLDDLEIQEREFDLFVALDDQEKIEFLFDAAKDGVDLACVKQISKLAERFIPKRPILTTEDYQVGNYRLCVTTVQNEIYLNSNSLKAIKRFIAKLFNDGLLLMRMKDKKKTSFDLYRYFRAYKVIGQAGPISSN